MRRERLTTACGATHGARIKRRPHAHTPTALFLLLLFIPDTASWGCSERAKTPWRVEASRREFDQTKVSNSVLLINYRKHTRGRRSGAIKTANDRFAIPKAAALLRLITLWLSGGYDGDSSRWACRPRQRCSQLQIKTEANIKGYMPNEDGVCGCRMRGKESVVFVVRAGWAWR